MRNSFFERLLRNGFRDEQDIALNANYLNIEFLSNRYIAVYLTINGYDGDMSNEKIEELNGIGSKIDHLLRENATFAYYYHHYEYNSFVLIIDEINKDKENIFLMDQMMAIREKLLEEHISISFGIGKEYNTLLDIGQSVFEAKKAAEYANIRNTPIMEFMSINKKDQSYFYPIEIEFKLINLVKAGNFAEVKNLLDLIFLENENKQSMNYENNYMLLNEIKGTVLKLEDELYIDNIELRGNMEIFSIKNEKIELLKEIHKPIIGLFQQLCAIVNDKKKSHNIIMKDKIIEYININYVDPNLCLNDLASIFNMSEKYISKFIKEQTGLSFSYLLENIRIDKAKLLLTGKHINVNAVSEKVGYQNTNTFYKAFKRVVGANPTLYKQDINEFT